VRGRRIEIELLFSSRRHDVDAIAD